MTYAQRRARCKYPHRKTYRRAAILERAWGGHVNVSRLSDGGFVGGYESMAAAERAVDAMLERRAA